MLKELSKEMSDDMYSPMKDMIGKKGLKKVSVMSDSPEGLKKGLSMAEKIMQAKSSQEDNGEESEDESCPKCKGKGCPYCECYFLEEDESLWLASSYQDDSGFVWTEFLKVEEE